MKAVDRLTKGIYLRGGIYWFRIQRDKKRHFVSLKTNDLSQAIRNASKLRKSPEIESGSILIHAVERFIKYSTDGGFWTAASADAKGCVLKGFAEWCGPMLPSQINSNKLRAYFDKRRKSCTEHTAYGNMMSVRSFFNWCRDVEKTVRTNPCDDLFAKKRSDRLVMPPPRARKNFCTREMRDKLISECPREDLKFVLYCGFHAGLRLQEICEARPFWFDMDAGLLHLRKTETIQFKDREERTIPMTKSFKSFIQDYGLREPFMLHPENGHGKNRYRWDPKRPMRDYMKAQQCEWVTFHILRHTFASLLASAGVSIYKIAVWLGDDVRVVQRHYAKLLPGDSDIERAFHSSSSDLNASQAASNSTRS